MSIQGINIACIQKGNSKVDSADIQHIQKILNDSSCQLTVFADAHRQRIQSFENIRSQQDKKLAALQTENNRLIDLLKTGDVSACFTVNLNLAHFTFAFLII